MEHLTDLPFDSQHPEPPLRVRGPASLAAAIPYLIDVPPQGRVVLAVVGAQNLLAAAVHAPIDPFPIGASDELRRQWADDVATLIGDGLGWLDPAADERMAVAVFLPAEARLTDPELSRRLQELARKLGERLLDMIAVHNGRWRSYLCQNEDCCPAAGAVILDNNDAVRVSAELIGASLAGPPQPEPQRAQFAAEVQAELQAMPYPRTIKARRELLRQVWPMLSAPPPALEAIDTARLVMAADRPGVRDALITRMARWRSADPSKWTAQGELWRPVVHAAPRHWRAGAACILAVSCWARRDLVGTRAALELALDAEPTHKMAGLIHRLVLVGIPAGDWLARMAGISERDCLRFDRPPQRPDALDWQQSAG